ncbi:MAG: hypothetical protein KKI12_04390 [Proteobacteria bacterium]|nr:hypothetical protein [Pseudomonadota bacterium]MBU4287394.1 hypothetical protein [Pseudomonadota bacterium]
MEFNLSIALKIAGLVILVPGMILSRAKLKSLRFDILKKELDILNSIEEGNIYYASIKKSVETKLEQFYSPQAIHILPSNIFFRKKHETPTNSKKYVYSSTELFINWLFILGGLIGFIFWTYKLIVGGSWWALLTGYVSIFFILLAMTGPDDTP